MNASLHGRPLTLLALMPHNGGMVTIGDGSKPNNTVTLFTQSVETMARMALCVPKWSGSLYLIVKEASRTDPHKQTERTIEDHDEIEAWLIDAIHEAEVERDANGDVTRRMTVTGYVQGRDVQEPETSNPIERVLIGGEPALRWKPPLDQPSDATYRVTVDAVNGPYLGGIRQWAPGGVYSAIHPDASTAHGFKSPIEAVRYLMDLAGTSVA
jgi:hypothetical protein